MSNGLKCQMRMKLLMRQYETRKINRFTKIIHKLRAIERKLSFKYRYHNETYRSTQ